MRVLIAAAALALVVSCGAPTEPQAEAPQDAHAGASGVGAVPAPAFTMESEAVVGLWSFARDCGLYDLVFGADANVEYYDYSNEGQVVSYAGTWAPPVANSVALTLRRLGPDGAPSGDPISYKLDVTAPVTDDLIGSFGLADGSGARDITARRCPQEDRD